MSRPRFTTDRGDDLAELRQDVKRFAEQMGVGAGAVLIISETVNTAETAIAHGRRAADGAPDAVFVMPQADARVWQTQPPDETFIYLQASVQVTCNLLVV